MLSLAAGVAVATLVIAALLWSGGGTATVTGAAGIDTTALHGEGPLDGLRFDSELGPLGKPADVDDMLVFHDGMFVSEACERRCDYPARPYYARRQDGAYEFVSITRCPHKDATIEWRGTVRGDAIEGTFTWTVDRWYWHVEKVFSFKGTRVEQAAAAGGG